MHLPTFAVLVNPVSMSLRYMTASAVSLNPWHLSSPFHTSPSHCLFLPGLDINLTNVNVFI